MAYTGYLVTVYMDANPYSETYGQERTERELDTENCPVQKPANYVEVYTYCEMTANGAYTGNCVRVYEDVEPMSATYGEQREELYTDGVLCPPDSEESDWQEIDSYCEQIEYLPSGKLGNSGYEITVYQDKGDFSPTYGQTRESRDQNLVDCPLPDTSDVWVIISETCHLVNGLKDGTKDVVRVNTNEYSPNYNDGQSETINVQDLELCPLDPESPQWTETSYVCVLDEGYRTGYVTVTEEDINPQSATYGETRTRTYQDEERCPYQEKPQPVTLKYRIVNNRSASTDTITSITLNFNNNFSIEALGSIAPAGGTLNGTTSLPYALSGVGLVCSGLTLSPNSSLPTLYQFSQTANPYTWSDSDGEDTLIITLWDGDGTGPEWTETSYYCETAGGYRTGSSVVTEQDMNTESATYGQTRTRTIENDPRCPAQTDAVWVETSWTCEQVNGFNTGNRLSVQTDTNPNSSSYGSTRTRIIADLENCPVDTTANWVETGYVCEQVDGFNSGNTIITEIDNNPGSATYGQTRTRTVSDDARCVRNTTPNWVEESWICEQNPNWVEQSRTCEQVDGANTGYAIVVELDTNPYSSTYNQTRTSTVEDLVNCPLPAPSYNFKVKTVASDTTETTVACNDSTTLERTEIVDRTCVSAIVGDCVTRVGASAFRDCTSLESVVMSNSVTSTATYAFYGCTNLTDVNLSENLTNINQYCFQNCRTLTHIEIPDSVTMISASAFYGCNALTTVVIGTGVTGIYGNAFETSPLTSFTIKATTPPSLGNYVFGDNKITNLTIYVPSESVEAYKTHTSWKKYASKIQAIPNS